jgi:transposase
MKIVSRQSWKAKNKLNCSCHCDFMTKAKKPKQTFLQTWGRGAFCLQSNRRMKETN